MTDTDIFMDRVILQALEEDLGSGDLTTDGIIDPEDKGNAILETREPIVLAGLNFFRRTFNLLDHDMEYEIFYEDGQKVSKDEIICKIRGSMATILKGERTALNFLQRMSGIATMTSRYVSAAGNEKVKILDTRKTVPGLRLLDKYAVRMGGGFNHRTGLYDGILIKDNHIAAAGSVEEAVKSAIKNAPHTIKVEVEVEDLSGLEDAIRAGAEVVLLDNMSIDEMKKAVELAQGRVLVEASGGITIENIKEIAATGVDMISVGVLTHSVKAVDLSLEIERS
jgi:nicotinate-nucleotide pyrophosphorylase (carboxylating)